MEQGFDWRPKRFSEEVEHTRRHAIGAGFVFLELLMANAERRAEFLKRQTPFGSEHTDCFSNAAVDRIRSA